MANHITAIVIGAGPSITKKKHLAMLAKSKFKGTIILTDKMLEPSLKAGITPDKFKIIVVTCEYHLDALRFFNTEIALEYAKLLEVRTFLVQDKIDRWLEVKGYKVFPMKSNFESLAFGNVGGIAYYLGYKLGFTQIILIGMDHSWNLKFLEHFPKEIQNNFFIIKDDYCIDPMYQYFTRTFLQFVKIFNVKTINCTEGGSLYGEGIISMKFREFLNAKG